MGRSLVLVVRRWMKEEPEVFAILLAWEDGDGNSPNTGNKEAALHSTRSDLEGRDPVGGLTTWIILRVLSAFVRI